MRRETFICLAGSGVITMTILRVFVSLLMLLVWGCHKPKPVEVAAKPLHTGIAVRLPQTGMNIQALSVDTNFELNCTLVVYIDEYGRTNHMHVMKGVKMEITREKL
jgi:hypothetical protein